jgi:lipoate-protein ligase A
MVPETEPEVARAAVAVLLVRDRHPESPAREMAFSEALLREVAAGTLPPLVRVFRPGATMAFGRRDALEPGFAAAFRVAGERGFPGVVRLGGGRAAGYDEGSVIIEVVTAESGVVGDIEGRFATLAAVLHDALGSLGIAPETGELPGEYCPGRWSLHARGSGVKLAGLAQRSVRGAALTTAVVVVEGAGRLRHALSGVYAALGLTWDPTTAGAAEDLRPGLRAAAMEEALIAAAARRWPLRDAPLNAAQRAAVTRRLHEIEDLT